MTRGVSEAGEDGEGIISCGLARCFLRVFGRVGFVCYPGLKDDHYERPQKSDGNDNKNMFVAMRANRAQGHEGRH